MNNIEHRRRKNDKKEIAIAVAGAVLVNAGAAYGSSIIDGSNRIVFPL